MTDLAETIERVTRDAGDMASTVGQRVSISCADAAVLLATARRVFEVEGLLGKIPHPVYWCVQNPGKADRLRRCAELAGKELGIDADEAAPTEFRDAIKALHSRADQAEARVRPRGQQVALNWDLDQLRRIFRDRTPEQVVGAMSKEVRSAIVHALYAKAFPSWDQSDGVTEELALSLIEQRDEALADIAHHKHVAETAIEREEKALAREQGLIAAKERAETKLRRQSSTMAHYLDAVADAAEHTLESLGVIRLRGAIERARISNGQAPGLEFAEALASAEKAEEERDEWKRLAQEHKVLIDRATGALTDSGVAPTYPPEAGILALTAERDQALARAEKAEAKLEYVSGYQADLVAIDRVLDQMDAPHDPEDGASLSPKRIRLLAEERDQAIREREGARELIEALIDAGKDLREVTREHEWPRACRAWDSALGLAATLLPPETTDTPEQIAAQVHAEFLGAKAETERVAARLDAAAEGKLVPPHVFRHKCDKCEGHVFDQGGEVVPEPPRPSYVPASVPWAYVTDGLGRQVGAWKCPTLRTRICMWDPECEDYWGWVPATAQWHGGFNPAMTPAAASQCAALLRGEIGWGHG